MWLNHGMQKSMTPGRSAIYYTGHTIYIVYNYIMQESASAEKMIIGIGRKSGIGTSLLVTSFHVNGTPYIIYNSIYCTYFAL